MDLFTPSFNRSEFRHEDQFIVAKGRTRFRPIHHDGKELFVLGLDDPRGGQAVGVWVDETAVKLSGYRTIKELVTIAHSLKPYHS